MRSEASDGGIWGGVGRKDAGDAKRCRSLKLPVELPRTKEHEYPRG